tara:strand:- start:426 stop:581 length:156 start_codon:yes stop_codon:yes gene_type:complete
MTEDDIDDVYSAAKWLRQHGIQLNNKQGVNSYEKKVVKEKKEMEYSYTARH